MRKILNIVLLLISITSQSQNVNVDNIVSEHLKEFRDLIGKNSKILIAFDYELNISDLNEGDVVLQPYINPDEIKKKHTYFVKFLFSKKNDQIIIKAINFRIKRVSRKELELINMGNGKSYPFEG